MSSFFLKFKSSNYIITLLLFVIVTSCVKKPDYTPILLFTDYSNDLNNSLSLYYLSKTKDVNTVGIVPTNLKDSVDSSLFYRYTNLLGLNSKIVKSNTQLTTLLNEYKGVLRVVNLGSFDCFLKSFNENRELANLVHSVYVQTELDTTSNFIDIVEKFDLFETTPIYFIGDNAAKEVALNRFDYNYIVRSGGLKNMISLYGYTNDSTEIDLMQLSELLENRYPIPHDLLTIIAITQSKYIDYQKVAPLKYITGDSKSAASLNRVGPIKRSIVNSLIY